MADVAPDLSPGTLLTRWRTELDTAATLVTTQPRPRTCGRLTRATGLVLEVVGLNLQMGAHCVIEQADNQGMAEAEVVGFTNEKLFLMPFEETSGLVPGARVWPTLPP